MWFLKKNLLDWHPQNVSYIKINVPQRKKYFVSSKYLLPHNELVHPLHFGVCLPNLWSECVIHLEGVVSHAHHLAKSSWSIFLCFFYVFYSLHSTSRAFQCFEWWSDTNECWFNHQCGGDWGCRAPRAPTCILGFCFVLFPRDIYGCKVTKASAATDRRQGVDLWACRPLEGLSVGQVCGQSISSLHLLSSPSGLRRTLADVRGWGSSIHSCLLVLGQCQLSVFLMMAAGNQVL